MCSDGCVNPMGRILSQGLHISNHNIPHFKYHKILSIISQLKGKRRHENNSKKTRGPASVNNEGGFNTCMDCPISKEWCIFFHIPPMSSCMHPGDLKNLLFLGEKKKVNKNCSHGFHYRRFLSSS